MYSNSNRITKLFYGNKLKRKAHMNECIDSSKCNSNIT